MSRRARAFSLARDLKHADSACYGEPVDVDALICARVGDTVACDVREPYPQTHRLTLETPAAAAHATELLQDKGSGWRLVESNGQGKGPRSGPA